MMKSRRSWLVGLVALAAVVGVGSAAVANRGPMRERFMKHMIDAKVAEALDEIQATPEQRALVEKQKERVVTAMKEVHAARKASLDAALDTFLDARLDEKKVGALRTAHQAEVQKVGDVAVAALTEVHRALSPQQRKQLVEYVKEHARAHH